MIGSVRDASLVDELVQSCDVTVHLAAAVGVRLILEKPSLSIHTNVNGTENVVHAASSRGKLVIIASTSEVYGKSTKMPFAEDDDLVLGSTANLRWSYACAKALDECLALSYAQEKKLSAIIVRLFNTTGPRQTGHYGMVLPGFVSQALKGEPITVYGSGRRSRCFAHVADVVESLVRLMNTPSALGEIFNVGNDEEITIEDLAAKVKQAAGSRSRDPQGSIQRGLRRGIRGHGAPRARRAQARAIHRLSAADVARPDHRGHRRRAAGRARAGLTRLS